VVLLGLLFLYFASSQRKTDDSGRTWRIQKPPDKNSLFVVILLHWPCRFQRKCAVEWDFFKAQLFWMQLLDHWLFDTAICNAQEDVKASWCSGGHERILLGTAAGARSLWVQD
jgi:hypothetical protein